MKSSNPEPIKYVGSLFSIEQKVIIITGGSNGIGLELSKSLSKAGALVYSIGRSKIPSNTIKNYTYVSSDITDFNKLPKLIQSIFDKNAKIDVLINCAGISINPLTASSPDEYFDKTIETNLKANYILSQEIVPYMSKNGGGSIINITSINSQLAFPNNPAYVTSKGGLSALTRALALDLSAKNIRVNAIAPGYIQTKMTKKSYDNPEMYQERLNRMIIQRWGKPEDIVGLAIFLSSNASSYLTGQEIFVDGGWTIRGL